MNSRGFSLVEVVIAIGIFAFAAVAIVALLGQGMKTSGEARLETVAALLSGKVNSTLRASSAWSSPTAETYAYTQNKTLSQIAAGSSASTPLYFNISNSIVPSTDPDRQFAMKVSVDPFTTANFSASDADVNAALGSLGAAQNTVLLNVEVSYPALATNEAVRSKRYFSSIITRTSTN